MYYPKIKTLFFRDCDKDFKIRPILNPDLRQIILGLRWLWLQEKIDGTNASIYYGSPLGILKGCPEFTEKLLHIRSRKTIIKEKDVMCIRGTIEKEVDLAIVRGFADQNFGDYSFEIFGEVYGSGINTGAIYLPKGEKKFIVFDMRIGNRWLEYDEVDSICQSLGLMCVPRLATIFLLPRHASELPEEYLYRQMHEFSNATTHLCEGGIGGPMEGIVVRTDPIILTSRGDRVIAKVKGKDYPKEEK